MEEVKVETNLIVCHGCLSSDRKLIPLRQHADTFVTLAGNQSQGFSYGLEDLTFCWECIAMLRRCKAFQCQLKKAQNVLMQMLYELNTNHITLSKLGTASKFYFDHNFQHVDVTEVPITHIEPMQIPDTEVKIENCYDNCYDSFVDSNDNISETKDDQVTLTKSENVPHNNQTKTYTKAKRRKLIKSRDNSVGYYKQYATLLEREKIDWGNIPSYFTTVNFGENEMEDHFLMKERKFAEHTRFPFNCCVCELGYMKEDDLKRHNDLNHPKPGDTYKCSLCGKTLSSHESLEKHWRKHTPISKCNICGDVCRPRGMKPHLNYAHTSKYACQFCNLKFGTMIQFSIHYKELHQVYICDYCGQNCRSKHLIAKHIRSHHISATCQECCRVYPNHRLYKRHCVELHPDRLKRPERPEMAYCVECDKQYVSVSKYKKHLKVSPKHTEIKKIMIPCPDCGKIFRRKNYLNNHYNLYHLKKSKHYCELCDKFFANGYGLRKHKTHVHLKVSRVKDKMCDLCGRGFATNRILINHRRTHTGERPYQCPHCGAAFTQKQAMHSHCRTQHKDMK